MKTNKQKTEEMKKNIKLKIDDRKEYIGMINGLLGHKMSMSNGIELREELKSRRGRLSSELNLLEEIQRDFDKILKEDETSQGGTVPEPYIGSDNLI